MSSLIISGYGVHSSFYVESNGSWFDFHFQLGYVLLFPFYILLGFEAIIETEEGLQPINFYSYG